VGDIRVVRGRRFIRFLCFRKALKLRCDVLIKRPVLGQQPAQVFKADSTQ
jgi:hypothetical protein